MSRAGVILWHEKMKKMKNKIFTIFCLHFLPGNAYDDGSLHPVSSGEAQFEFNFS